MSSVDEALRATGFWLGAADERPALRAEFAGLARRVRARLARTVGLVPAGDDVAVPAIAIHLGRALADASAGTVGVVDAHGSWTCARALVEAAAPPEEGLLSRRWLLDNLAVLTAPRSDAGVSAARLRGILREAATFRHLVVDLTGFDHLGEQLAACELLDAVVLVARSGRSTTRQMRRWLDELPDGRDLGVLLTGL